jgi:beta-N-acetylhexosaminidase
VSLGPLMISVEGASLGDDERNWLASPLIGGVILFARNFADVAQLERLVADIHAIRDPSLLVAVDQEGGRVQRFGDPFTRLPPARVLGHLHDEDHEAAGRAARAVAWTMAAELLAVGVDMSFAPVVDLDRGLAGVIGDRALHEDAGVVAKLAREFCAGCRAAGMTATAKHFPTHAGAIQDSHTELAVDRRDLAELVDDLAPYRRLISSGLHSVMMAHVSFPEIDEAPASMSRWWIETQLRGEMEFSGAIISDDMSMVGASTGGDMADRVRAALDAGCDLVLICNAADRVPDVLAALDGYVDPAGELRLMRLRGKRGPSLAKLRESVEWQRAHELVESLNSRPALELEG